ncbi:hypothetical protein L1887_11002 [Cichorium endivia]|nr:hypothetical protein L1887_11002 [Cichorium endivia]
MICPWFILTALMQYHLLVAFNFLVIVGKLALHNQHTFSRGIRPIDVKYTSNSKKQERLGLETETLCLIIHTQLSNFSETIIRHGKKEKIHSAHLV